MTADEARLHLRYSSWASRRLLDAALALDEETRTKPMGVSHGSLYGTLEHIFFGDRSWWCRITGSTIPCGWEEFSPGETLALEWPQVLKQWEDWAANVTGEDLTRLVDYHDWKGNPFTTPVWQIVLHVVNHATLHRGQAMLMLRQLGIAPPPTDLIFYYRQLAKNNE